MCGRYTREYTWKQVHDFLDLQWPSDLEMRPRYNVAPTQRSPIVRLDQKGRGAEMAAWGLRPAWMQAKLAPINARCEAVASSPMFRSAFKSRRCIVPVSGFYEWRKIGDGPKAAKQPWYIHRADGAILLFAGLWELGQDDPSFTIITTVANGFMRSMHDRMPAVLEPESVAAWRSGPVAALPAPAADGVLTAHRVSSRVNAPKNDGPDLIERVAAG